MATNNGNLRSAVKTMLTFKSEFIFSSLNDDQRFSQNYLSFAKSKTVRYVRMYFPDSPMHFTDHSLLLQLRFINKHCIYLWLTKLTDLLDCE